jgi:hypothetical protein
MKSKWWERLREEKKVRNASECLSALFFVTSSKRNFLYLTELCFVLFQAEKETKVEGGMSTEKEMETAEKGKSEEGEGQKWEDSFLANLMASQFSLWLVRNVLVSGFSEMLKAMFLHSSKTHSCLI